MNTGSYPTFVTAAPVTSFNTCSSGNITQATTGNKYTNVQQQTATVNANTIVNTSNTSGQVVALLNSDEAGVTYLRPLDSNGLAFNLTGVGSSSQQGQIFTIPITVPGSKPGEQSQTIQIQVVGQGGISGDKLLPVFGPVLQLAYNQQIQDSNGSIQLQLQQEGDVSNDQIHNNNNDSMQSSDLLQDVQEDQEMIQDVKPVIIEQSGTDSNGMPFPLAVVVNQDMVVRRNQLDNKIIGEQKDNQADKRLRLQNEQDSGNQYVMYSSNTSNSVSLADYISMNHDNLPLGHFLKFSPDNNKRDNLETSGNHDDGNNEMVVYEDTSNQEKGKRKKKYKKKPPAARKPRPGQIHIATALDGTLLFCCPECSMAYPDKEMLEQHLVAHKIERRFICDLCGAGLKRKEHLERHKLGHNPERPFVCNVCCKGFKRKEHLNLHAVIHSGVKTEVCPDCGKGFYRRDHLRKHTQSHITKRLKEEQAALQQMAEHVPSSDHQKLSVPELIQNSSHSGPIINVAHQEMIIDAVASGRNSSPSPPCDDQIVIVKDEQKLTDQEIIMLQQQQIQQQHQQQQQQQQQQIQIQQQPNSPSIAQQEMIIEAVSGQQHHSPSPPHVDHHQVVITKLDTNEESKDKNIESIVLTQSDAREALGLLHHQSQ